MDARERLLCRLSHDDALSRGEAIGLNDAGTRKLTHVRHAGSLIGEAPV